MSTLTQPRRSVKPAHGTCRLTLHINGTPYGVRPVDSPDGRAFRLRKPDGTAYDVAETAYGPTCDCPDFTFNRDGIDPDGCKHIRALAALTLIGGAL